MQLAMSGSRSLGSSTGRTLTIPLALAVVIALMQIPWLNPASIQGSRFAALLMDILWCAGLVIWLLGVVRRHRSQFGIRTLAVVVAVAALFFGACRALGPPVPMLIAAAGASAAMLLASRAGAGGAVSPFRNPACRAVMTAGGLLMLAHVCRISGQAALIALGVLEQPNFWV